MRWLESGREARKGSRPSRPEPFARVGAGARAIASRRAALWVLLAFLASGFSPGASEARQRVSRRILLVGDSWASALWRYKSLDEALEASGHPGIRSVGGSTTVGGSSAADWNEHRFKARISSKLRQNRSVDVVHLSTGGADALFGPVPLWELIALPEAQRNAYFDRIIVDIDGIVEHVRRVRPGAEIVLQSYAYMNFLSASGQPSTAGQSGFPWLQQVLFNWALRELEQRKSAYAQSNPGVTYVPFLPALQTLFGIEEFGISPEAVPVPDGIPFLPSPRQVFRDPIHANREGYRWLATYSVLYFYDAYFRDHP